MSENGCTQPMEYCPHYDKRMGFCRRKVSDFFPPMTEVYIVADSPLDINVEKISSPNTQSDEIAAIRKRLSDMESSFHDFVMLHEPVQGFDSMRI